MTPLRNTSSELEALPSEVRIENDSDRTFSKSKLLAEIFFRFSEFRTYVQKAVDVIYIYRKHDILPADLKEYTRI